MENNQELLSRLEKHTRQQLLFTKILCILCALAVVCSLVLMFAVTGAAAELLSDPRVGTAAVITAVTGEPRAGCAAGR